MSGAEHKAGARYKARFSQQSKVGLLLFCFALCALAVALNFYMQLHTKVRPSAFYLVVNSQVKALRDREMIRARSLTSDAFQRKFQPIRFLDMNSVRRVEFGEMQQLGRRAMLRVYFIKRDYRVVPCTYYFVNDGSGWKIDNVDLQKSWPENRRISGLRV